MLKGEKDLEDKREENRKEKFSEERREKSRVCKKDCPVNHAVQVDWYSRCIVGWDVDDTLDTRMVINVCKKAFRTAKPEILNSELGKFF